jgi:hypothetical protein
MTPLTWTGRLAALAVVLATAATASAQQPQPQFKPIPLKNQPGVLVYPQFNSFPGLPAQQFNPPVFNPGPFYNPALNNPWMNQTNFIPVNPFAPNPFAPNPFVNNPFNNPFANNLFAPNPFNNPFNNPLQNQFPNAIIGCFGPVPSSTPPIAVQQPGYLVYKGPDLQVNPWSGTVYRPLSGVARTADGSVFFRVPGTGLPTVTGNYATGTGLYYNPNGGTFLNPSSGVISRPGVTNVFIPWIPR